MLCLIKKDLFMIKGNDFLFMLSFMSIVMMMTTFSYDEFNKVDAFITTFPSGKINAVRAKYLSTLFVLFVNVIITVLISIISCYVRNDLNIKYIISTMIGCCSGTILFQSIFYPCIYKFGIEKSRIGIFISIFGLTGLITILIKNGLKIKIPQSISIFLNNYWMIIIPILIILILYISYKISKHIYLKKEF